MPCVEPPPVHKGYLQSLALVESTEGLGETGSGREGQKMDTCSMVLHRCCIKVQAQKKPWSKFPVRWVNAVGKKADRQQGAFLSRA